MTLRPRASTSPGSCVSTLARRTVWQGQLRGRGLSEEYSHPFKDAVERLSFAKPMSRTVTDSRPRNQRASERRRRPPTPRRAGRGHSCDAVFPNAVFRTLSSLSPLSTCMKVPGPASFPVIGSTWYLLRHGGPSRMVQVLQRLYADHGSIVRLSAPAHRRRAPRSWVSIVFVRTPPPPMNTPLTEGETIEGSVPCGDPDQCSSAQQCGGRTWSTWSAVINLTPRTGELRSASSWPDARYRVTG